LAEQAVVANAVTRGVFGTSLTDFVGLTKNFGPSNPGTNNSYELTAMELINFAMGGKGGVADNWTAEGGGVPGVIKRNVKLNAGSMLTTVIAAPIAFRMAKKLLGKPLINPANRLIRSVGIREVKV